MAICRACGVSFICKKNNSGPNVDPWETPLLMVPTSQPKCCWSVKLQDSLKCNISRKKWMTKFIFGMQTNIEVFYYQVDIMILAVHSQSCSKYPK